MYLGQLISWLEQQDQNLIVKDGFSTPHSDRGSYDELAFTPKEEAKICDMLDYAKFSMNKTFTGYKGGEFTMDEYSTVLIGEYGVCGEVITSFTLNYWLLTARMED